MAKTTQNNAVKPGIGTRIVNFFKNLGKRIATSFREMAAELKKVVWPTRKELINYSLVVIAFMIAMGIVIGLIDAGSGVLMQFIVGSAA